MKKSRIVPALLLGLTTGSALPAVAQLRPAAPSGRTAVNPTHEELKTEADQAYQKGNYARVIELAERVLREAPKDHVALYLRGSARVEVGLATGDKNLVRTGIADSREAIGLGGADNVNYYLPYLSGMTRLAAVENRKEHAEVSEKVATDLLARLTNLKSEEKANILYQRGTARVLQRNSEGALNDFQAAIKLNPAHLGSYMGIADAHFAAGLPDKSEEALGDAVRAFPNNPLVYNNRGMFLQNRGKFDKAQADFTRALELDRNYYYAYTNRGFALMSQGQPAAAEADFTQSLRISPNQPGVYSMRATARLAQGNMAGAAQDQTKVIEMDPNNAVAHADLGFTKFFSQDFAGALQAFNKAAQLSQQVAYLAPWQYWAMVQTNQKPAAERVFSVRLAKAPADRDWTDKLLAYLAGQTDASALLGSVANDNPQMKNAQFCEAHFFIGLKETGTGDPEQAAEHFRKALETGALHLSAYRGSQLALERMKVARR